MIKKLILAISILLIPSLADAATYYTCELGSTCGTGWSTGNNSNACTSKSAPCLTIIGGLGKMDGGDTLVIGDGQYTERITGTDIPDGNDGPDNTPRTSDDVYTKIMAENVHGVEVINTSSYYFLNIDQKSFVWVDGLKVNGNGAIGAVIYISLSDHVKLTRCAAYGAGNEDNNNVIDVDGCQYVLVEECWAWGSARYKIGANWSDYTVFRRNVARHDYVVTSIQCSPFINYDSYMTVWQNNIAIDSDPNNQYCSGHMYGGFYFENKNNRDDNRDNTSQIMDGNIILNVGSSTYAAGMFSRHSGSFTANNQIIYGQTAGFALEPNPGAAHSTYLTNWTVGAIDGDYDGGNGLPADGTGVGYIDGADVSHNTNFLLKNSVLFNLNSYGVADWARSDWNAFYGNGANAGGDFNTPAIGTHSITTTNPQTNSLLYLPRIETGSALKTAGDGGAQIGAEVMYKLGVSGTLYGETGWNTLRSPENGYGGEEDRLWPFPNEALIKTDMASYSSNGPAGARGFAATGNGLYGGPITLTSYIWEQLGNAMPSAGEMYPDSEVDGACGTNSGGSFYSLTSGTSGNCATGTVASFTGSGPWTWGCDGSGGGTSTAADACSASLLTDSTAPIITAFTMPETATSTTVSVSSFTATDAIGVTGYCITTTNSSSGCSWTSSAPTTATGAEGANTFYAWARDAALNVSAVSTDTTTITLPECTYYVRPDGNNSNTGTANTSGGAWLTIQNAVLNVDPGDTVCVADGTYAGFNITVGGTSGSPITYRALGSGANITSGGPVRSGDGINIENYTTPPDYVTIDGFNVYNQTAFGIRIIAASGIIIQNCTIHDNGESGILSASTNGIQILNNTAYENGDSAFEHNVYLSNAGSDNCIVRGNHLYSAGGGSGLQLNGDWEEGGDGFIDNALVEDNIIHDNAAKGMSLISVRYATVRNNIVYNAADGAAGIHIVDQKDSHYSIGNTVVNNTIDESNIVAVRINTLNTGNVIFNNVAIGGIVFEGSGNYQSNNVTTTTGFTNRTNHDYSLAAGSDKIDAGLATYQSKAAATDDYLGISRPQNSIYDVGAYEFEVSGSYGNAGLSGSGNAGLSGGGNATVH